MSKLSVTREPVAPSVYRAIFEDHRDGAAIMDELIAVFYRDPFVKGAQEAERETLYRLGQRSLLDFIMRKINQSNGVNDNDGSSDN